MGRVIDEGWKDFCIYIIFWGVGQKQKWGWLNVSGAICLQLAFVATFPQQGGNCWPYWKPCECADRLSASEAQGRRAEPGETASPGRRLLAGCAEQCPVAGTVVERSLEVAWPLEKASPREGRAGDDGWEAPCPGFNVVVLLYYLLFSFEWPKVRKNIHRLDKRKTLLFLLFKKQKSIFFFFFKSRRNGLDMLLSYLRKAWVVFHFPALHFLLQKNILRLWSFSFLNFSS